MSGVFISYRREDTGGAAGRLYDRLCARFGPHRVFRDVDTIEPGERFTRRIEERLAATDVLIALIGREWLSSAHADGRRRLQDRGDFVRLEIATALRRGIPVIPALLHDATMPREEELPSDLAPLAQCQAIQIDDADFHEDVGRLIDVLEPRIGGSGLRLRWPRTIVVPALALLGLVVAAAAFILFERGLAPSGGDATAALRSDAAVLSAEQVRALIIQRGFFTARTNPAGGAKHDYRQEVSAGAAIVVDRTSGLMWEQTGSGRIVQGGRAGALAYAQSLNSRRFGGFDNWRLPTLEEALSLLAAERTAEFHLSPVFNAASAAFIWTVDDAAEGRGWVVYYHDGFADEESHDFNAYVRAVRSHSVRAPTPARPSSSTPDTMARGSIAERRHGLGIELDRLR
jgi:hypothetical protein